MELALANRNKIKSTLEEIKKDETLYRQAWPTLLDHRAGLERMRREAISDSAADHRRSEDRLAHRPEDFMDVDRHHSGEVEEALIGDSTDSGVLHMATEILIDPRPRISAMDRDLNMDSLMDGIGDGLGVPEEIGIGTIRAETDVRAETGRGRGQGAEIGAGIDVSFVLLFYR